MNEPLAIIGMDCRFPGGADDVASFWRMLRDGVDAIVDTPRDRWDLRRFYDPDPARPGRMYVRQGGFLRQSIYDFDAQFFGISPREAMVLDPQQRLLLEVAWEVFEDAGVALDPHVRANTGVYIGAFYFDNAVQQIGVLSRDAITAQTTTSSSMVMLSNRISYALDLRGPSMTVDTACSSSLVALHLAVRALQDGECELALAGGVNVMLRPEATILECKGGFLSPDGRCKTFDAGANGYVRGEGAGAVLLKRLSYAQRDGDRIYALLLASGVNQDGRTIGITVPNPDAQKDLILRVCAEADVRPSDIAYVEAHGTGTQAGDPAEARALGAVYASGRPPGRDLWVGAVKTNIGHLEAAAGIAGVMKAALVLGRREIPPNLHLQQMNPRIDAAAFRIRMPRQMERLDGDDVIFAGVNSFGYGGTNAHAVLRSAPAPPIPQACTSRGAEVFVLSARTREALDALAVRAAATLVEDVPLSNICAAAARRRTPHPERLAIVTTSVSDLREKLTRCAGSGAIPQVRRSHAPMGEGMPLAFVYSGMGAQYFGMGAELFASVAAFADAIDECDAAFRAATGRSLRSFFETREQEIVAMREPEVAQPCNLALQIALTRLWASHGVVPAAVVGHSVGEIAAAVTAGSLSIEEAFRLTAHRSALQQRVSGRGGMLAAGVSPEEASALIGPFQGAVEIAAINGDGAVTLSGDVDALTAVARQLEAMQRFQRRLEVSVAYHSRHLDPLEDDFRAALGTIHSTPPRLPLYSTFTGTAFREAPTLDYWWGSSRGVVRLAAAIRAAAADGYTAFVEISAHPVLTSAIGDTLRRDGTTGALVCGSLTRGQPEQVSMLESLAAVWTQGGAVDWSVRHRAAPHVELPKYPWQRTRLWSETALSREDRLQPDATPLLHRRVDGPAEVWESDFTSREFAWLADHRVGSDAICPGALFVTMALAAAAGERGAALTDVSFERPLLVSEARRVRIQSDARDGRFTIAAANDEGIWTQHASGRATGSTHAGAPLDLDAIRARCKRSLAPEGVYADLVARGLTYGPAFRTIFALAAGDGEAVAALKLAPDVADADYALHPALLDGALQSLVAALVDHPGTILPIRIEEVRFHGAVGRVATAYAKTRRIAGRTLEGDIALCDDAGHLLAELRGCRCILTPVAAVAVPHDERLYGERWEEAPLAEAPPLQRGTWLVMGSRAVEIAAALQENGQRTLIAGAAGADCDVIVDAANVLDLRRVIEGVDGGRLAGLVVAHALDHSDGMAAAAMLIDVVRALSVRVPAGFARLCIVTSGTQSVIDGDHVPHPAQALTWGLGRVIASEHPELLRLNVDLPDGELPLAALVAEILTPSAEDEVALRAGRRYVNRLVRVPAPAPGRAGATPFELAMEKPGVLETMAWRASSRKPPQRGQMEMRIDYVSIHFKDIMKAMNLLGSEYLDTTFVGEGIGMECSGVVTAVGEGVTTFRPGDEVVSIDAGGCFRTLKTVSIQYAAHRPSTLSAAQSPCLINFLTPYYGMRYAANAQPGETILIHAATGGVGLAAIQIARWLGLRVLATAGSEEKRAYLRALGIDHVGDSRSLEFADMVDATTAGAGVDIVLNSLSGEGMQRSMRLLAPNGRFLEIGKRDIAARHALDLADFERNLTYVAIDTDRLGADKPVLYRRLIDEVCELFEAGVFTALPVTEFPASQVIDAFRLMARAKHIGKVVVRMNDPEVPLQPSSTTFKPDATYLVTGGLGGFGMETAKWLVARGARHLVLTGRRGAADTSTAGDVDALRASGAVVHVVAADAGDADQMRQLFATIDATMPPLRGVFHAAMVLDDSLLNDTTHERFARVLHPKMNGARHLHELTAGRELDHFVLFSSFASLVGNRGQASYVAANAYLDALARHRRARGLPALSVNWGPVANVGLLVRNAATAEHMQRMGVDPLNTAECVEILGLLLTTGHAGAGYVSIDWREWGSRQRSVAPRFGSVIVRDAAAETADPRARIAEAPPEERLGLIEQFLTAEVSKVLCLPVEQMDPTLTLDNMGVDSLMLLELANALHAVVDLDLAAMLKMQSRTIAAIAADLLHRLEPAVDLSSRIDGMAESELDALLADMTRTERRWSSL